MDSTTGVVGAEKIKILLAGLAGPYGAAWQLSSGSVLRERRLRCLPEKEGTDPLFELCEVSHIAVQTAIIP